MTDTVTSRASQKRGKGGSRKGIPNVATQDARAAIGKFVDSNAHRLTKWLDQVSDGVTDASGDYVVKPNPERAFAMFQSVIEYHVPKLARSEITGADGGPVLVMATQQDVDI